MNCGLCGTKINKGDMFCIRCGTKAQAKAGKKRTLFWIIGGTVVLAAAAVAVCLFTGVFGGIGDYHLYFFISEDERVEPILNTTPYNIEIDYERTEYYLNN